MNRINQKPRGNLGEDDALAFLLRRRLRLRDRNFSTPWGELDLIVEDKDGTVIFVEVKARFGSEGGSPLEQVDREKIARLKRAIARYAHRFRLENRPLRLDAVGILYDLDDQGAHRIKNISYVTDLTGW